MTHRAAASAGPHWGLMALSWLAAVNARAPLFALGPVLPLVVDDLGLSFTVAGVLPSVPLVLMGLLAIPGGFVSDRFGARRLTAASLLGITLAGAARAAAPSAGWLVAATLALGAAVGIMQPALAAMAREAWPHRVGLATALYSNGFVLGSYLGTALAPALLVLAGPLSWRGVLLAWAVVGALGTTSMAWSARHDRGERQARFGGLRSMGDVYATPGILALTVVLGSQSAVYYALGTWLPAYLAARGWALEAAAGPTSLLALAAIPAGLVAPALADTVGSRPLLVGAGLVTLVGQAGLVGWTNEPVWVWVVLVGAGTTAAFSVSLAGPAALAPPGRVGATAGAMLALAYVGSMVGPFAVGVLRDLTGGYEAGFATLVGLAVVLIVSAARVPRRSTARAERSG